MDRLLVFISCEHGGNQVPRAWAHLFEGRQELLAGHRGWDPGALALARRLSRDLGAALFSCTVTRLLVDCNRSPGNPRAFSEITRGLDAKAKAGLMARYHRPHWKRAEEAVRQALDRGGRALLLSCHSFTPVMDGKERNADLGLLYDPARPAEKEFCEGFRAGLLSLRPGLRVRRNYPYRGVSDGLATHLRKLFGPAFLGIEIEMNQAFFTGKTARKPEILDLLSQGLGRTTALHATA